MNEQGFKRAARPFARDCQGARSPLTGSRAEPWMYLNKRCLRRGFGGGTPPTYPSTPPEVLKLNPARSAPFRYKEADEHRRPAASSHAGPDL